MNVDGDPIFAVVANKNDLYEQQQVKDEDGKAFAKEINAIFQSTSAKDNHGITNLFENIGKKYFNPNYDTNAIDNKEKEEYEQKKNQKIQQKKQITAPANRGIKLSPETVKKDDKKKGCC